MIKYKETTIGTKRDRMKEVRSKLSLSPSNNRIHLFHRPENRYASVDMSMRALLSPRLTLSSMS